MSLAACSTPCVTASAFADACWMPSSASCTPCGRLAERAASTAAPRSRIAFCGVPQRNVALAAEKPAVSTCLAKACLSFAIEAMRSVA